MDDFIRVNLTILNIDLIFNEARLEIQQPLDTILIYIIHIFFISFPIIVIVLVVLSSWTGLGIIMVISLCCVCVCLYTFL